MANATLQNGNAVRYLHGYIIMKGRIKCETGLQIGGVSDSIEIGGIDRPIMRDPISGLPYIPGSSLRGKLRSLLEKFVLRQNGKPLMAGRPGSNEGKIWRHECNDFKQAKECPLCRVFGSTAWGKTRDETTGRNNFPSVLLVRDCVLKNKSFLCPDDLLIIEAKMENTLDRLTSAALPRTFERVPAGAEFGFELIYKVESILENGGDAKVEHERVKSDIQNLLAGLALLENDGLGGSTSRGYGKVSFQVAKFHGFDAKGQRKGGFSGESKSIAECKTKIADLDFCKAPGS